MSLHSHPSLMSAGAGVVISPDGSDQIPPELWAEYAALVLLQPEPALHAAWIQRLEAKLGVRQEHRRALRREPYSTAPPWSILCVSPRMERKVEETLRDAGLQVYVPIEKYRPANTWRHRTRPLMPGYLFANLCDDRALDIARANYAVRQVMCKDGQPVKVPSVMIGTMILLEAWHEFDRTWKPPGGPRRNKRRGKRGTVAESRWKHGQRVTISDGPFAGFVAEIMRADREDRVEVMISVFGRATLLTLDEAWVDGGED